MSAIVPNPDHHEPGGLSHIESVRARELFWQNVARDILTTLSVLVQHHKAAEHHRKQQSASVPSDVESEGESDPDHPFDGRMAVITRLGQRIPIAEVHPLFACSIDTSPATRTLSAKVQCSVFQIRTPAGEVYTIPLHEIASFHALTPELMKKITDASSDRSSDDGRPFGFAAFRSLAETEDAGPEAGE